MRLLLTFIVAAFTCQFGFSQDALRFNDQVQEIRTDYPPEDFQESIVFTGSSTIRRWKDLQEDFPEHRLVNAGFGGSQASDLLYYIEELILDYHPSKVFIYEGDNDINAGKSNRKILETLNLIVSRIELHLPDTEIIIISPKPSIARWELADKYNALNQELKTYSLVHENVKFADLWTPMLNKDEKPQEDIFLEDNLHMNRKGYEIWAEEIAKYLD